MPKGFSHQGIPESTDQRGAALTNSGRPLLSRTLANSTMAGRRAVGSFGYRHFPTKATAPPMSLAVVLLNWRHTERTLRCARAVASWHALQPHLAVVDNESTEVTRGVLSAALPPQSLICSAVNL